MTFLADLDIVATALDRHLTRARSGTAPVLAQRPLAGIIKDLDLDGLARRGGLEGRTLERFMASYLENVIDLHHPGYLGHQVAVPHHAGGLGALVDGILNNPMAIYEMGPGAAAIEYFVVNWLLEKTGWTPSPLPPGAGTDGTFGGGVLTHGGSLANLTALNAARRAIRPDVWEQGDPGDLALMASESNHYSIERGLGIMGLGTNHLYAIPTDARGAIDPTALPDILAHIRKDGRTPMALVANACSTAVGIYDPLRPIGEFCRKEGIWFHVDGAHGASALLSPELRHRLDGVELADSLIWDAHKMMRTPSVCAALLVRDHRTIDTAFSQDASYLFHDKDQPGFDFLHRAVECTKSALGLKFFLVLAALGEKGLATYVEQQYRLATEAHRVLQDMDFIEIPVAPEANILCFRMPGPDDLQLDLRRRILAAGDFYITSTQFRGKRYLRVVFMNPETTLNDFRRLMEQIREMC